MKQIKGNISKKTEIKDSDTFHSFGIFIEGSGWFNYGNHLKEKVEKVYEELKENITVEIEYEEKQGSTGKIFKNIKEYTIHEHVMNSTTPKIEINKTNDIKSAVAGKIAATLIGSDQTISAKGRLDLWYEFKNKIEEVL